MSTSTLLQNVESRLGNVEHPERITHSVLYHLWRRMPFEERQRFVDVLQDETVDLLSGPENPNEPAMTADQWDRLGSIEDDYLGKFCDAIREETGLAKGEEEDAIEAVFNALKAELPDIEVDRVREMLPKGLKETWAAA